MTIPKIFSSISTSVTWILSYTVLNILQLGWAVAPVQWEAQTPLAVLWLPRAHGQSSSINQALRRECWVGFLGVNPDAGEGRASRAISQGGFAPSWAPWEMFLRPAASQPSLPMTALPQTSQGRRQQTQIFCHSDTKLALLHGILILHAWLWLSGRHEGL